jgi:hypothetical protein
LFLIGNTSVRPAELGDGHCNGRFHAARAAKGVAIAS